MGVEWKQAEIIRIERETEKTWRFFFRVLNEDTFDFSPGQFVTFDLPIHDQKNRRYRSYSISSNPNYTNCFELIIVLMEGGLGTEYLFNQCRVGSVLYFMGPLGKFKLPQKIENELCFICTGTGIAPFRSQLLDILHNNKAHENLYLIFGSRYKRDLLYFDEMKDLENKLTGFRYIPTLSREKDPGWKGQKGYVHPIYERLFKGNKNVDFYICGWQDMITEARERLETMGFSRSQIHYESYG